MQRPYLGNNYRFDHLSLFYIFERLSDCIQSVSLRNQRRPVHAPAKALQYLHGVIDMGEVGAPAAAQSLAAHDRADLSLVINT